MQPLTVLNEEEQMFAGQVADFANEKIKPMVMTMDQSAKMDKGLLDQARAMGLLSIEIPVEYGGAGGSFFQSILAIEELAKVDPSVSVLVDVQNTLVINAIRNWGTEQQKKKYLTMLAETAIGSYALSESSSGSDAFALKCRAKKADGGYTLTGSKLWITNANESDVFIVMATLDPEAGYRGITSFIVERGFEGFSIGKKEDKLGIRASSTCELIFDECFVPEENVLGPAGKGYKVAIETLNEGRIGIGAQMLGLADGALKEAIAYSKTREQFGRPIAKFQAIEHELAKMAVEVEAARLLVYNAARLKEAELPFRHQASMAKYQASMTAESVASRALELFGGNGFIKEYPMEKFYRDSKIGKIYEGTSFMQLSVIAAELLND